MIEVEQTILGKEGNCFSACLASLLEIKIEDVPYLNEDNWIVNTNKFLMENYNSYYMEFDVLPSNCPFKLKGYHIINGLSPRSEGFPRLYHAVIGKDGKMVFDPHPSKDGLQNINGYGILIPMNPAELRKEFTDGD